MWETPEHRRTVQEARALLTRGCGCKTGCRSKRCQRAKKGHYCELAVSVFSVLLSSQSM